MRRQRRARVRQERRKSENRRPILKMLCAALLRLFRGQHSEKMKGGAQGNWDPREGQQPFRPNPNGAGDRTTTLRRLLIGAVSGLSPQRAPPSFNFQKARWDGFASYFDSHCLSAEEYSSLSLSSAAALFTSLALNAAKSSIPFDRIKRPPKAWWSVRWKKRLVKDAGLSLPLTEVMKTDRLTSPLLDVPCQSSPRPRLRHGRRLALLFQLGLTLNLYALFFAVSLAYIPRLLPLLTFPAVLLPGNRLRFMPPT